MPDTTHAELTAELAAMRQQLKQVATDVSAILRLVDVQRKYTPRELFVAPPKQNRRVEAKPPSQRRGYGRVSPQMQAQAQALFAQGWSTADVARRLGVGKTTAHMLKHGRYPTNLRTDTGTDAGEPQ